MNLFIHPHNNPKIEWPMATYKEPKPKPKHHNDYEKMLLLNLHAIEKWHQSSLLAYIKEPGFKEREIIIEISTQREMEVGVVCGDGSFAAAYIEENKSFTRTNKSFSQDSSLISHYQERQQIDPEKFKYVREDKRPLAVDADRLDDGKYMAKIRKTKWQEVKEPDYWLVQGKGEMTVLNPKYNQFHQGCREGTILLTPKWEI